jgi:hypothetical protein
MKIHASAAAMAAITLVGCRAWKLSTVGSTGNFEAMIWILEGGWPASG